MTASSGIFRGSAELLQSSKNPKIYNPLLASSAVEYSQALSAGVKKFTVCARGNSLLRIAFVPGETTGTEYKIIHPGAEFQADDLNFSGIIYLRAEKDSTTVEILEWT